MTAFYLQTSEHKLCTGGSATRSCGLLGNVTGMGYWICYCHKTNLSLLVVCCVMSLEWVTGFVTATRQKQFFAGCLLRNVTGMSYWTCYCHKTETVLCWLPVT
jgi:hypothetical protein